MTAWLFTRQCWLDLFDELKQDPLKNSEEKENSRIIMKRIKNKGTNKRFPTCSAAKEDILRFMKGRLSTVSKEELNKHSDVSPCANGCVHHLQQPPIFGNGIPSDLMILQ